MTGRTPNSPKTPGSGRKRGTINKQQRAELTDRMAKDLLTVYTRLGGVKWLLQFAKDNPAEFLRQGLSRLLPAPQKDDPDVLIQQQFNGIEGNPVEMARRIAFALSLGLEAQGADPVAERQPYSHIALDDPIGPSLCPAEPDPAREAWAEQVTLSPEERLNNEDIDRHTNRRAFAETSAPVVQQKGRVPVRLRNPRNREDLL